RTLLAEALEHGPPHLPLAADPVEQHERLAGPVADVAEHGRRLDAAQPPRHAASTCRRAAAPPGRRAVRGGSPPRSRAAGSPRRAPPVAAAPVAPHAAPSPGRLT